MGRAVVGCGLALLAVCGCKSSEKGDTATPPGSLATGFKLYETRLGSDRTAAPETSLVDYESGITLRPDRERLVELIGVSSGADPTLSRRTLEELNGRIRNASESIARLEKLSSIAETLAEYEEISNKYYAELEEDPSEKETVAREQRYEDLLAKREIVISSLTDLAWLYAYAFLIEEPVSQERDPITLTREEGEEVKRQSDVMNAVYKKMAISPAGAPNRYDAEEATRVFNKLSAYLNTKVQELESAVLDKAPEVALEMEARLLRGGKPYPVSISPYTVVEGSDRGAKSPRVGLPGKDDMAAIQQGYKLNGEVATSFNKIKDLVEDDEARKDLLETLRAELKRTAKNLADGFLKDLKDVAALEPSDLEGLSSNLPGLQGAAKELRNELVSIVESIQELGDSDDLVLLLSRSSELLETIGGANLADKVDALKDSSGAFTAAKIAELAKANVKTLLTNLSSSAEKEAHQIAEVLEGKPGGEDIGKLVRSILAMHDVANSRSWGALEPGNVTKKSFSLNAAQDGFVDLANSPADSGDRLAVEYKVIVNPDGGEKQRIEHRGSAWVDIRKFGVYTTLKSQLIFYDRLHDGNSSYQAAPALGLNVHTRPDSGYGFWDGVNPGLGISVSTPSFDTGVGLAVGLQATFFNDMLQTGYAYNISEDQGQEFFYFGLDLIGAFQEAQ